MRPLTQDLADTAVALDDFVAARRRRNRRVFLKLAHDFDRVTRLVNDSASAPSPWASPSPALLHDLLVRTQEALALVVAESGADDVAALELIALIEAVGRRVCDLAPAVLHTRRKPPFLLS